MNTFTWNCSKNKRSVHQLLSFNSSVDQYKKKKEKRLYFFTGKAAECKSGSVISPNTLRKLPELSLPLDVYIFLYIFSYPFPLFCLMNFQSVRPLYLHSLSLLTSLVSVLSLSFMAYSCAAYVGFGWGLVGPVLWGWATFALHIFEQSEIFMYVCLCLCVRVTSRVCVCCIFFFTMWCIKPCRLL